jgi:hypothetical protein
MNTLAAVGVLANRKIICFSRGYVFIPLAGYAQAVQPEAACVFPYLARGKGRYVLTWNVSGPCDGGALDTCPPGICIRAGWKTKAAPLFVNSSRAKPVMVAPLLRHGLREK